MLRRDLNYLVIFLFITMECVWEIALHTTLKNPPGLNILTEVFIITPLFLGVSFVVASGIKALVLDEELSVKYNTTSLDLEWSPAAPRERCKNYECKVCRAESLNFTEVRV